MKSTKKKIDKIAAALIAAHRKQEDVPLPPGWRHQLMANIRSIARPGPAATGRWTETAKPRRILYRAAGALATAVVGLVLFAFLGLALDVGHLVMVRTQMQKAVDAAVTRAALNLPNQAQAIATVTSLLSSDNFGSITSTVTFSQDTVKNSSNYPEINCSLTNNVPTYFMRMLGLSTISLTATAEAVLVDNPGGPFNYTLFSNLDLPIKGSQNITGSAHSNHNLTINGNVNISGVAEGATGETINGSGNIGSAVADTVKDIRVNGTCNIGSESGGATNIPLSNYNYSQQIASTAATTYNTDHVFNGNVNINGNISVYGNVTLNGSINDTGAILATGNITVNGSATISGSNQVFLYSSGGQITINGKGGFGSRTSSVILYAPNGTVTVNGSRNINGHIIASRITLNGSENVDGNDYPVKSLSVSNHAKLIS
ncbi:MAG: pilus assembly protein TadG-related protein [Desulfobaccales bacterium]